MMPNSTDLPEAMRLTMSVMDRIAATCPADEAGQVLHHSAELLGALASETSGQPGRTLPAARQLAEILSERARACPNRDQCHVEGMVASILGLLAPRPGS